MHTLSHHLMPNKAMLFSLLLFIFIISYPKSNAQVWKTQGPGPLLDGQSEGIEDTPVIGAVHGIATHPTNANIIYIATVNGGIWKTSNATSAEPNWTALTDHMPSLSMSDIEFDPSDDSYQTLIASYGKFSSLGRVGGSRNGVLHSTNGGLSWTELNGTMSGKNITSVEARGATMMATVDFAESFTCGNIGLFRSTNTGANWIQVSAAQGLNVGAASALTGDPTNPSIFYTGIHNFDGVCSSLDNGIYKSVDTGATWVKVSDSAMDGVIGTQSCHFEIAVGNNNNVFVSMVCASSTPDESDGQLDAVFYSANGGDSWLEMDIPGTTEEMEFVGIHPGRQGFVHSSIVADPTNHSIVYIGGDRQPSPFPNSIGAGDFSGRLFKGDASMNSPNQWVPFTHSGTASDSSPHADSRDMKFDVDGHIIEADDGGVYKRITPLSDTGDWLSLNGDLKVNEQHDMAFDTNSSIVISGNQDNGTGFQTLTASPIWEVIFGGDGGDVVVDNQSLAGSNQSIRYISIQNLGGISRLVYDQNNNFQSFASLALEVISGAELDPQFVTPLAINNNNGNRIIIGAENSVYESLDQGDTLSEIGPGISALGFGRNTIAYGAMGNEDILYVGACQGDCNEADDGEDGVFVRTTNNGPLNHVYTPDSGAIRGMAVNPEDPSEAFLIENTQVKHSTDFGQNWTNITGNIGNIGLTRSILYISNSKDNKIAVGTNRGVFIAQQSDGFSSWENAAQNLPNAPVFDLSYDETEELLYAGTLGRGAFAIASDEIFSNSYEGP